MKANATELPPELGIKAVSLAKKIETENLYVHNDWYAEAMRATNMPPSNRLHLMRLGFTEAIWKNDKEIVIMRAQEYYKYAQRHGNSRDQDVGQLFTSLAANYETRELSSVVDVIEPYVNSSDWFVQHRALNLKLQMRTGYDNANVILQSAHEAFKLIPNSDESYVAEARISSLEDIGYLHNLLRNPELGLEAYVKLINLSSETDSPINGINIINNLIFSFNAWRDHQTTSQLVDTLITLEEKTQSGVPGLSYLRGAQIHNDLGDYVSALKYAEASIEKAVSQGMKESAELSRIIALLGLNEPAQAQEAFRKFNTTNETTRASSQRKILYIKALFAMTKNDNASAISLLNQRFDETVQHLLSTNSTEMTSMLAALENSKERQDEREKALKRETELQQVALARQKRVNNLLIIIAIIFAVSAVVAIAFARYRSRTAAQMSEAAAKARAGEKAKSEFLAVMSHELRTPLNGILGLADFLSRTAPTEDLRDKNKIIFQSGQDLLSLVENILDMTLLEGDDIHPMAEETDIRKILAKQETKWREVIAGKDIIFTTFVDPTVPEKTMIDPRRVSQCVDNLLSNAVKFTMAGRIHMHVTAKTSGIPASNHLTIVVADTGTGISEDAQTRLFKPFVQADSSMTRHFGGAGLGLAIARGLARLMGGDITVISRENRGSEFTLTLVGENCAPSALVASEEHVSSQPKSIPVVNIPTAPDDNTGTISTPAFAAHDITAELHQPAASVVSLAHINVLVVEDDLASQDVLRTILAPTNCAIDCATDGQMALIKLSQNTYDIVFMDVRMPGMDGVTAIRRIRQSREAHNHVPIITVTADVSAETNIKCMAAGVDIFLTKPVRSQELLDAIAYVLQDSESRQTA